MTYSVFSGTLNPTQSINDIDNDIGTVQMSIRHGRCMHSPECRLVNLKVLFSSIIGVYGLWIAVVILFR